MNLPENSPAHDFYGIPLRNPSIEKFCEDITNNAKHKNGSKLFTYINAHCVNLYFENPSFQEIIKSADYVYADGMSIVRSARRKGIDIPERVSAADFFIDFCQKAAEQNLKIYFLGGYKEHLDKAIQFFQTEVPSLNIVGSHDGFFEFDGDKEKELIAELNHLKPDIVVVGMSAPRQEEWVVRVKDQLDVPVFWCVGALYEYFSGERSRAPEWMRTSGMEWIYRLVLEPKRLWKRYLIGNFKYKYYLWKFK